MPQRHEIIGPTFLHQGISAMRQILPSRVMLALLLVVFVLFSAPLSHAAAPLPQIAAPALYAPGEVIVGWLPGSGPVREVQGQAGRLGTVRTDPEWAGAAADIGRATGLAVLDAAPEHGKALLAVTAGNETAEIARLQALSWVRYAEPNYRVYAADGVYPNDPDFPRQWNLQRVAAPDAWSMGRGSYSFVVAVIDSGVQRSHPDLAGNSPLLAGYNYINPGTPPEDDTQDSHGTHVTGILAAHMGNGTGIAGLAPDIKILPLKVLSAQGYGDVDTLATAIYRAVDSQAQVINLSLATPSSSQTLQDAVTYAAQRGALIVAAAGNCAQDLSDACGRQINPTMYPAAYPGVLAVAASDRFDRAVPYSGYKPYIGLAAPGGTATDPVWSTVRGGYGALYGTSMSAPLVSAAAALVWTQRPAATPSDIADILKSTADKVGSDPYSGEPLSYGSGRNDYFGSGRLNVANAVRWVYPPSVAAATSDVGLWLGDAFTSAQQTVDISNPSGQAVYWQATVLPGASWLSLTRSTGTSLYGSTGSLALRAVRANLPPGTYLGTVRVQSVYPPSLPPVDIRVTMRVSSTLIQQRSPYIVRDRGPAWLDPDASDVLMRGTLPLGNNSLVTVQLPFPVTFYGGTYQLLQVSDNGLVTFSAKDSAVAKPPATCPGNGMPPNNAIYVLGYDWNPALGGQITVHQPDASTYVVTWQDIRREGSTKAQSFQLVITNDSRFYGNYRAVESPTPGMTGTEDYSGTFYQQVLCNGAGRQLADGDTVRFETRLPW